ncbi:unnamed protein product [Dicrocoelium dendriticum]|nr:unnamed protein product [Dicrocoelium dendriticum]
MNVPPDGPLFTCLLFGGIPLLGYLIVRWIVLSSIWYFSIGLCEWNSWNGLISCNVPFHCVGAAKRKQVSALLL